MTLHPIPAEFPDIWWKFYYNFLSVNSLRWGVNSWKIFPRSCNWACTLKNPSCGGWKISVGRLLLNNLLDSTRGPVTWGCMADHRSRPSMHTHNRDREELRSGHPVQYLHNISHGQNLSSSSGEPEFVVQEFFEIPASGSRKCRS